MQPARLWCNTELPIFTTLAPLFLVKLLSLKVRTKDKNTHFTAVFLPEFLFNCGP
jgi:hypothetical protein